MPENSHSHSHSHTHLSVSHSQEDDHNTNMWKGFMAMIGLVMFFFTEKSLNIISEWRRYNQSRSKVSVVVRYLSVNIYLHHPRDFQSNNLIYYSKNNFRCLIEHEL